MNNYELHSRAHELAASHSGYNLARRLLALEEEFKEYRDSASAVPYWLSDISSQLYQACGAYDMPDRVMDVLSDLQGGKRPKSVDILPVNPPHQDQGEAIQVCPLKDRECGDKPIGWCERCPKGETPSHAEVPIDFKGQRVSGIDITLWPGAKIYNAILENCTIDNQTFGPFDYPVFERCQLYGVHFKSQFPFCSGDNVIFGGYDE